MPGRPRSPRPSAAGPRLRGGRLALWLAVLALTLQGVVPLAHGGPGPRPADGTRPNPFLCLAVPAKAQPADENRGRGAGDLPWCPVCQSGAFGASLPPPAVAALSPPTDGSTERPPVDDGGADGSFPLPRRARAPPLAG